MIRCLFRLLPALAMLSLAHVAHAQQVTGNQRTSQTGTGQTGTGQTSAGVAGTNMTGFSLGERFSSSFNRFTGGSQSHGQTTAGAAAAESGLFGSAAGGMGGMGQMDSFGRGGMGNMMGMGMMGGYGRNSSGMYGGAGQQAGRTQQRRIRTHIRLGFSEPGIAPTVANNRVSKVFDRVLQREDFGGGQVNVAMDGTVAVLTGTVPTDHARFAGAPGATGTRNLGCSKRADRGS